MLQRRGDRLVFAALRAAGEEIAGSLSSRWPNDLGKYKQTAI